MKFFKISLLLVLNEGGGSTIFIILTMIPVCNVYSEEEELIIIIEKILGNRIFNFQKFHITLIS